MATSTTEVNKYLRYVQTYLIGDLETFHDVCKRIEEQEKKDADKKGPIGPADATTTAMTTFGPSGPGSSMNDTGRIITSSMSSSGTSGPSTSSHLGVSGFDPHSGTSFIPSAATPFDVSEIPPYFRCTAPITLSLFSTADLVGYLLRDSGNESQTKENLFKFFDGLITTEEKECLVPVFRHGMAHAFFPKLDVGFAYHSSIAGETKLFYMRNNKVILNVNVLERMVVKGLNDAIANETPKMQIRYQSMIDKMTTHVPGKINAKEIIANLKATL